MTLSTPPTERFVATEHFVGFALLLSMLVASGGCASRPRGVAGTRAGGDAVAPQGALGASESPVLASCSPDANDFSRAEGEHVGRATRAQDISPCVQECDRGIASACATLAVRAERGDSVVPRDLTRAAGLHERACELRDSSECVTAARMHASGIGVTPNRAKQMELLVIACNLGDAAACSVPAKAYAAGTGVSRDEHKARALFERACAGGVETACEAIGDGAP